MENDLLKKFISAFPLEFEAYVVSFQTKAVELKQVYEHLPARFPPLYEQMVLSYRWFDIEFDDLRLRNNPIGDGLIGFKDAIFRDKTLIETLLPNGYMPFGQAGLADYDQICFDISRPKNGDYAIVKVEHEAILCNSNIGRVTDLAGSFEEYVKGICEAAEGSIRGQVSLLDKS